MPQPYRSQILDHLGLVAGMVDELGIADVIDQATQQNPETRLVTVGHAVKAMVLNGLGFVNQQLYLVPMFFQNKPTHRLIRHSAQPAPVSCINCLVGGPERSQPVPMLVIEIQHEGSLPTNTEPMDADPVLEDPTGRGVLDGLPLLVGKRRLRVLERRAETIVQGRIHHTQAVMTISNAMTRAGFLRSGEEAKKRGSCKHRQLRSTRCWPLSPASRAWGDNRCSSSSVVARMQQRCGAMRASWAASAAVSAPVIWSTTWAGAVASPGRPRLPSRGRGSMGPSCPEVACKP